MTEVAIPAPDETTSPFDAIRRVDEHGEYWLARELMPLMQYAQWRDFAAVVEKAKASLALVEGAPAATSNFVETRKISNGRGPAGADYRLTRFAAYLTAMAGDDTKVAVAHARVYFAVRTRQAELAEPIFAGDDLDVIEGMIRALRADRQRIAAIEATQAQQDREHLELRSRMDGIEGLHDWFSALAYAKMHGLITERTFLQRLGTVATAVTRRSGLEPKPTQHALYGSVNTYPVAALHEAAEILASRS